MPSDPLIGQQLDEYRLERLLGRGGMARVYEATDSRLDRRVAIKVIDAPYRTDQEYGMRFMREARAIAQLEHPYVVRLYRYGEVDELFYMAMQYIEGIDLAEKIAEVRQAGTLLPLHEVRHIITQVCTALDYVHGKGVIHRDIKPSNVMINSEGQAILTDFGLAMLDTTRTQGNVFGSPYYIAPEQAISSAGALPQSDFYSVGVMLYEMVTGELPFKADNALSIAMMHASDPPPPPRQIQPSISPALESVILRTLAKEPRKRFANGQAFVEALEQAIETPQDVQVAASPTESKRPLPPVPAAVTGVKPAVESAPELPDNKAQRRRQQQRQWLFVLLLVALMGSGVWLYFNNNRVRQQVDGFITQLSGPAPSPTAVAVVVPTNTSSPTPTATEVPPTDTPVPTNTFSPTATPTSSDSLAILSTLTTTPTLSVTPIPTDTSTPTASPTPSDTPSPIPTDTSTPTASPSPTATPTTIPSPTAIVIVTRATDEMPMILVPAGTFPMGSESAEDEQPVREVTLDSFYIDQYEVSVGQYAQFLNDFVGVNQYAGGCAGNTCLLTQFEVTDSFMTTNANGHTGLGESENRPVNHIRWHGAREYCQWVGGRLPTEAEWEYVARGAEGRTYPWGEEDPDETRAVFGFGSPETYQNTIQPVDALPDGATPLGVFGLAGGVAEWLIDSYSADFYASAGATNPVNTANRGRYVLRGGGWNSPAETLRGAARDSLGTYADDVTAGFRCAYDVEDVESLTAP